MRDNFTLAHTFTARWEGGLSDHEADPGGITNHGISLRWVTDLARQARERCLRDARQCDTCPRRTGPDCDYFSLDLDNDGDIDADDIRACTKEQAARLFRRHFWEALGCDRLPLPLAVTLYDGAVNMGASRAVKQLQEAMNATGETQLDHYSPIAEDGIMGPDTRELANALADRQGRALFCGTPKGCDNLLHDVWQLAGSLGTAEGWSRFRFPASQTGYLPQAELDAARRGMSEAEYQQEFECSFAAAVRGAYYAAQLDAADLAGRICPLPVSPDLPVHTAWDLGMDDATAIWFFQVEPSGAWRMLDYYEASGEGLAHYAAVLAAKARPEGTATTDGLAGRGFCYGRHLAPHDIRVRELGTGQSRLESAARLGIRFDIAPSLPLADGIDAVRRALPRLWFDSRHCAAGLAALRSYRRQWRPRQEQFSSGPLHDGSSHAADALRYAVTGFRPPGRALPPARARITYDVLGLGR